MPHKKIVTLLLAALLIAVSAFAQDYKSLLGKWNMTSETDQDPVKWTLVLKEVDGKLAAFLATSEQEQPAKNFTFVDGVIKFQAPYNGEDYDIELKPAGDTIAGSWSGNGDSGKTTGTRAQ